MAPIPFYMIQMGTVLFGGAVKKEMWISPGYSTNTAQETNWCVRKMEWYIQSLIDVKTPLHMACQKGHFDIIEFLLDNGADVNKQEHQRMTPLHWAIYKNHSSACKLILKYKQVSNQNIESGITMSRIAKAPEIQELMEKALMKRRKVILVCLSIAFNLFKSALDTELAQKICCFCKQVPQKRYKCTRCQIAIYCSTVYIKSLTCDLGLSDAALEDSQGVLHGRVVSCEILTKYMLLIYSSKKR
jgi:hypothetical protein